MGKKIKARVDANRKATPRTRLIAHVRAGDCISPYHVAADAIEDTRTGKRIPLM